MSTTQQELARISEKEVMNFLEQNPDFFDTYPQMLADIKLQHNSGKAVSLIERQVSVLREQRKKLKRQLQDLVDIARENDDLDRRLHQLTLRLIGCRRLVDVLETLKRDVQRDFAVDAVTLRLRPIAARTAGLDALPEFNADDETVFDGFTRLVNERKPVCGRFRPEQMRQLFPACDGINSAALIPLHDPPVFGMLALGSIEAQRFHPEQGTVFLAQLGELAGRALRGCIPE